MTDGMPARDPIAEFQDLFARASEREPDATAVALATADATGAPSVRIVLLKAVDAAGFVFFTNYESRKARELDVNPRAALCFYWPAIGVQVRVEGAVERVTAAESESYFATRPRESQLGAWASAQSQPLSDRETLLQAVADAARCFPEEVRRPPWWGGFRLVPVRFEFWTAGANRLHDRFRYEPTEDGWTITRLSP